ncbi:MAG: M14-type cytosolic carboxypeptidase, partial [Ekhidna sp.]
RIFKVNEAITIDNQFDGARFSNLTVLNDSVISITTTPENEPINSSPWYALRLVSALDKSPTSLTICIDYPHKYKHRYWPNISVDQKSWSRVDSTAVKISEDSQQLTIKLSLISDTIWIAAQPIVSSTTVGTWCDSLSHAENVKSSSAGLSMLGRKLPFLKIGSGKKTIVILSRQHPPEVTGFFALKYFLNEILVNELSDKFLKEYCFLVYPLVNPDGVDLGHWRHNAAGVDLNRDWQYYKQPEVNAIANHIINTLNDDRLEIVLGLDFHSTWYDVYYSTDRTLKTKNRKFTDEWFQYIENNIPEYKVKDAPSGLQSPVSKGWFVAQFNVPGITYEIGDNTPMEFIKEKSSVTAEGLM